MSVYPSTNPLFLAEQPADPSTSPNVGAFYSKDVAGVTTPFWRYDNNGAVISLTSGGGGGGGVNQINGDNTANQLLVVGSAGTDFTIVDGGGGAHTFDIPTASALNRGLLSSADWSAFNAKLSSGITSINADTTAAQLIVGTANRVTVNTAGGTTTLSGPQNIDSSATPSFAGLLLSGNINSSIWDSNSFLFAGNGLAPALQSTSSATNGQILIGATGNNPEVGNLTGTANQVIVTNGFGTITLSTPQDISVAASPTFAALTLSGNTAKSFIYSDANKKVVTTAAPTNGQLLIGSTGNIPAVGSITGTANQIIVTLGAGTIALSAPQDLDPSSSPVFANLEIDQGTIVLPGAGVGHSIRFNSSAYIYGNSNTIRFADTTNVGGIDFGLSTTSATINTVTQNNASIILQNQTFTPGATYSAVTISPTFATENFAHKALSVIATQQSNNPNTMTVLELSAIQTTGATTLGTIQGVSVLTPVVAGTATNVFGIIVQDQSLAGSTGAFGLRINPQSANATTTRAIDVRGNTVANAIRFNVTTNLYGSGSSIVMSDSSDAGGLNFGITSGTATINTVAATASILWQNQTFTPGAPFTATSTTPTFAQENFAHTAFSITSTQNGTNTNILTGVSIAMIKATGATTLATMNGLTFNIPTVTGTVTASNAISIADQTNVNITTARAVQILGTGASNAIVWGGSALQYASAAQTIRFADSTDVGSLDFILSTTSATINTRTVASTSIIFQNQTFTTATATVSITPNFSAENVNHLAASITAQQTGANAGNLVALNLGVIKVTAATNQSQGDALNIASPVLTSGTFSRAHGIVINDQSISGVNTSSFGIQILSQSANATTSRAIEIAGTNVNNAIRLGGSANIYASGANNIRHSDATNTSAIDFTLTAAGVQTIGTSAGNLALSANTGVIAVTTSRFQKKTGASVASANDITLGTDGNSFSITGTTTINTIVSTNWQSGSEITLIFAGALTVSNNTAGAGARIFLAASGNLTTATNTILGLLYDGTQWQETFRKVA